jgi:HlyD family secretion protein
MRSEALQLRDAFNQAQVDQKTAQRERDRSRKAYELGAYSELQALKAEDALEKAQFAFSRRRPTTSRSRKPIASTSTARRPCSTASNTWCGLAAPGRRADVKSPVDGQVGQVQVADRASVAKDAPL